MELRLVEFIIPRSREDGLVYYAEETIGDKSPLEMWVYRLGDNVTSIRVLLPVGRSEELLDTFENIFGQMEGFKAVVLAVQAVVPRPKTEKEEKKEGEERTPKETIEGRRGKKRIKIDNLSRVSREELYADTTKNSTLTIPFTIMMLLSAIVTTIGVYQNNVAIIIGGAVITPLLGPNMALSLAATLGDTKLAKDTISAFLVWILIGLLLSILIGFLFGINPFQREIVTRLDVSLDSVVLAVASGLAAALFMTLGVSTALIGVAQAVALLPPLVTLGLLIGSGFWSQAYGSLLLFLTNVIGINLAGVLMFVALGIRPLSWWDKGKARRATITAVAVWTILLAALVALIILSQEP